MRITKNIIFGLAIAFVSISCQDFETNLDVPYTNNPSSKDLGIESTTNNIFHNWYKAINESGGPGLVLTTMADETTCSWSNSGMLDLSSEPRVEFDNRPEYDFSHITSNIFNSLYTILADANSLLISLNEGKKFESPKKVEAIARFGQAISVGYLSLLFDKVWISDETGTLNNGKPYSYSEANAFALAQIDKAIEISKNNDFIVQSSFANGEEMDSKNKFFRFLNSFATRIAVNVARNTSERDAIDWNKVLKYTENGIQSDFVVVGDGWNQWINEVAMYSVFPGWGRTDMRVIHLMDSNTISQWTDSTPAVLPESTSDDKRLKEDFQYLDNQVFKPGRGVYHFSSYRHSRYDSYIQNNYTGEYPEMLKAEIDLYKAEAQLRLNDLVGAASTINSSTRVTRGKLPPVSNDKTEIENAIHYEFSVELPGTGTGLAFFEMRRNNLLQKGTILQFPVPGEALKSAKMDYYTFGGTTGTPGVDFSDTEGWKK